MSSHFDDPFTHTSTSFSSKMLIGKTIMLLFGLLSFSMCDARNPGLGFVIYGLPGHKLNYVTCSGITVMGKAEPTAVMGGEFGRAYYVCDVLSRGVSTVELRVRMLPSNKTTLSQECVIAKRDDLKPEFWTEPAKVIQGSARSGCLFVTDVTIQGSGWVLRFAFYSTILMFFAVGAAYLARRYDLLGKLKARFRANANWDEIPLEVGNQTNQDDVQLEVLNPVTATWDDVPLEAQNSTPAAQQLQQQQQQQQ